SVRREGAAAISRIDEMVAEARSRVRRYTAAEAVADGELLLVDIRSPDERELSGVIPGSKHVPLSVLLWRADQTSGVARRRAGGPQGLPRLPARGFLVPRS